MTQQLYLDFGYKLSGLQPMLHKVQSETDKPFFFNEIKTTQMLLCENIVIGVVCDFPVIFPIYCGLFIRLAEKLFYQI